MKNIRTEAIRKLIEDETPDGGPYLKGNGDIVYYKNGKFHREDGPAFESYNGTKYYYLNGTSHRENGPAVEDIDGYKAYYMNGQIHRTDGPAIIYPDGSKEYWVSSQRIPEDIFKLQLKLNEELKEKQIKKKVEKI